MKIILPILLSLIISGITAQSPFGFHIEESQTVLFGQDTINKGLKTMWLPTKGAFRSGNIPANGNANSNIGNVSAAFGGDAQALGNYSFATGFTTAANSFAEFSIGQWSLGGGSRTFWNSSGAEVAFEIGNGVGSSSKSNMFTVQKSGNVKVGNMTDPTEVISEKLDVDGGIVLSNAIASQPSAGTIQYNVNTSLFQGYNGNQWINLSNGGNQAEPMTCSASQIDDASITYLDCVIGGGVNTPQSFQTIPAGKRFCITHLASTPAQVFLPNRECDPDDPFFNDCYDDSRNSWYIRFERNAQSGGINNIIYELRGVSNESKHTTFNTPIIILYPGDKLIAKNLAGDPIANKCRVYVSGWLEDIN